MKKILNKKKNKIILSNIILLILLLILWYFKIILYKVFPQAYVIYENKTQLKELIYQFHPHFPRYLLITPSIFLSKILNINIHIANTGYSIILLVFIQKFMLDIISFYKKRISIIVIILITVFTVIISLIVNGRIIFIFLGQTLILKSLIYKNRKLKNFKIFIGILFTSASSGTLVVTIGSIILYILRNKKIKFKYIIYFLGIEIFIIKYVIVMLMRNYRFFDKKIINILNHGIFMSFNGKVLLVIVISYIIVIYTYYKKNPKTILKDFEIVALFGGMFGITTFFMVLIPGILHLFKLKFIKRKKNEFRKNKNIYKCNVLDTKL